MTTQQETAEKITLLRSLRGCPCTVIFALALFGRKMTNQELQLATGYSDKPITAALQLLTLHRMVVDTGKGGWTLSDGMTQLPLFPQATLDAGTRIMPAAADEYHVAETGRRSEKFRSSPLSSSSSLRSINHPGPEEEEKKPPQHRKNSEHPHQPVDNPVDNSETDQVETQSESVASLLIRAHIGRNSPKLRQILATNPNPNYIRAWVLYYEWWQDERQRHPRENRIDGRTTFSTGTLITCILDNDPAPPLRCDGCGLVGGCVCHIIKK